MVGESASPGCHGGGGGDDAAAISPALTVSLLASVAVLAIAVTAAPPGWLALPLFVAVSANGLIFGNATALAMGAAPRAAGSASAVLGAAQFLFAATVSPLVSIAGETTALPLAVVMVTCAVLAAVGYLIAGNGPHHRETLPVFPQVALTAVP